MYLINKPSDFQKYYLEHQEKKDQIFEKHFDQIVDENKTITERVELLQGLVRETMPDKTEVASLDLYTDEYIRLFEGLITQFRSFIIR